jgi:tetratricopeptide (TPR) repeat protein
LVLLGATLVCAEGVADRFIEQEQLAFAKLAREDYEAAIAAFEKQIAIYPDSPRPYYNIACCYALKGNAERAATWLELAVRHGWRNAEHLDADSDFQSVRESDAFRRARKLLDELPPLLPRRLGTATVPAAESVTRILVEGILAQAQLEVDERLLEPAQVDAQLFALYDRQMARLARYIEENGDARDAHLAGRERVRIASLYRVGANPGSKLDAVARTYIRLTAEEFTERWPTSPYLFEIRFWRAAATSDTTALRQLTLDAPRGAVAARAMAELMLRDSATRPTLYPRFLRRYRETDVGTLLLATRLWKIRLQQEGLPDGLEFEPAVGDLRKGRLVVGVVTGEDKGRVPEYAGERLVLIVLGEEPWTGRDAPRAKNPREAARRLGVPTTPIFLIFEDGVLVGPKSLLSQD